MDCYVRRSFLCQLHSQFRRSYWWHLVQLDSSTRWGNFDKRVSKKIRLILIQLNFLWKEALLALPQAVWLQVPSNQLDSPRIDKLKIKRNWLERYFQLSSVHHQAHHGSGNAFFLLSIHSRAKDLTYSEVVCGEILSKGFVQFKRQYFQGLIAGLFC